MNNVVLLLEDPPAASEFGVEPVVRLLEIIETHLPQT